MAEQRLSVRIRSLRPSDAAALGDLFAELDADPGSVHFHPHPFTADEARRIAHRIGIHRDRYFGAFRDGGLVGYGMLRGWDQGYAIPSFGVAVSVKHRGSGIGRLILRYSISKARRDGAEVMMLKVHPTNENAKRLYESEGFIFDPVLLADGQLRGTLTL